MSANTYTVKPNDTLSGIAAANGTTWQELAKINGLDNPDLIYPGQVIKFSAEGATGSSGGSTGSSDTGSTATVSKYPTFTPSTTTSGYGEKAAAYEKEASEWVADPWQWETEYGNLFKEYQNRPDFSYDFNTDALYQQYKDKYIQQGKMAMQDTIGQASAMTGGYGNSYAATAGNQAYQAHLQNLNDIIPELYQLAYDRYNQKGQDMLNRLGLYSSDRDYHNKTEEDEYNRIVDNRDYYGTRYDNSLTHDWNMHNAAVNYDYQVGRDAVEDEQWNKSYNLSERELQIAEEEWEQKKNDLEEDFEGPQQATTPVADPNKFPLKTPTQKETDEPDYSDWDAFDWEGYFAQIRNTESKSAAEEELDRMVKAGLIPQKMITYAAIGARGKLGH